MTCGAGRDAECAVGYPATPSFEKSHPGGLYDSMPRDVPAGRGVFGEAGCGPSAIYNQTLCSRGRFLIRVDNAITAGRDRAARRVGKLAAATKGRNHDLESRPPT